MKQPEGVLKAMRSPLLFELLTKKRNAFHLLFFIAFTLNRDGSPKLYGCKLGESRVCHKSCGLTDSQYRTAKKYLIEMKLAEFFTRGKGKGKKAYARLTSTHLFDPNIIPNDATIPIHSQLNNNTIEISTTKTSSISDSNTYHTNSLEEISNSNSLDSHNHPSEAPKNIQEQEEKKNKEKRRKKSQASDDGLRLAERLYQSILLVYPQTKKPSSMNGWGVEIDRIIQIDGRSIAGVEEIIDYLPHDAFWCNNVLSGNKLRKQFVKLEQAKLESEARKSGTPNRFASRIEWAKQLCRPINESNDNAFFSFRDTFLLIGDERKDETSYTKIFYSSNGFEKQVNNALRKWELK